MPLVSAPASRLTLLHPSLVKYGYPPKPIPANTAKVSSIPITRGEQIIVTERRPPPPRASRGSPIRSPAPHPPEPPKGNIFETAPTPKSTISTATHTPTPAPSVPRTIIPSPYAYPGTGPASAASTTTTTAITATATGTQPSLVVPANKPPLGSSPLAPSSAAAGAGAGAERQAAAPPGTVTASTFPSTETPTSVPLADGASLIHRIVPDDNSCLFSAIALVFRGGYDDAVVRELREGESPAACSDRQMFLSG